ncbi:MAG: hypothetical protein ACK4IX_09770 [Candidatus Sericytochromatia bacterium]
MNIEEILENAYQLFDKYKIGDKLQLCIPCCVSIDEEKQLVNTPLRKISRDLLNSAYYESARCYSDRELWEMKHFLPRVLELVCEFEFPCHSTELTFTRLDLDKTEKWDLLEIDFLREFSIEYFKKCLNIYPIPNGERITNILIMFGIGGFDLKPILNEWIYSRSNQSLKHFKDLFMYDFSFQLHKPKRLINAFSTHEIDNIIFEWISSESVKKIFSTKIENIIINDSNDFDSETISQLSWIYDVLDLNKY